MSQRWESMFCLAVPNTECVSITYSPILLFCLQEQSTRYSHPHPISLDKCFLHQLTPHLSVTLVLIRERLNWGKAKMEHTAINWVWFIIDGVQCAVPWTPSTTCHNSKCTADPRIASLTAEEREFSGQDVNVPKCKVDVLFMHRNIHSIPAADLA